MILDIDIGNTRTKWLIHRVGEFDDQAVAAVATANLTSVGEWEQYPIERVRISSVVDSGVKGIVQWSEGRGIKPELAAVRDGVAGVTCGYRRPEQLGIDRWLAMLAAREFVREDCLVVSAGTAVTLDVLLCTGRHLGGFILPGLAAMSASLNRSTAGIDMNRVETPTLQPGLATPEAVWNGALLALVASVEKAACLHRVSRIIVTGGDGPQLAEHLVNCNVAVQCLPHLVLRGLSVALP